MANLNTQGLVPIERIAAQIYVIRGHSVMLDANLAACRTNTEPKI